jgi:hypothetical protein
MMPTFRVIVTGAPGFRDYKVLRDSLDRLLADRLPDVVILTRAGAGLGTDALAASYAAARRLDHVAYLADHQKHQGLFDADRARNAEMGRDADALVMVFDPADWQTRDLAGRCRAKGIPIRVLGMPATGKRQEIPPRARRGGPPD